MGIEDRLKPKAEAIVASPEELRAAYDFATRKEESALSIDDPYFAGIPEDVRQKDAAEVARLEGKFRENERTQRDKDINTIASAFEYVIYDRINHSGWLGDHMSAALAAPPDDYSRGIDLYAEDTRAPGRPIGFSIDVTFSRDRKQIDGKLQGIKNTLLDRGKLAELRYYKPLAEHEQSAEPVALPKVIVGVEKEQALNAIMSLSKPKAGEKDWRTGLVVLHQIEAQLKAFKEYSELTAARKPWIEKAIQSYADALGDLQGIQQELYTSLGLDAVKVRALARTSIVTQHLEAALEELVEEARGTRRAA